MSALFDYRQIRRAFSRAADTYTGLDEVQREIGSRLADSLDYLDDPALALPTPEVVVDLGAGPGHMAALLQKRWPRARVLALDVAPGMLAQVRGQGGGFRFNPFAPRPVPVAADARALPLADRSVDVLYSNLCLQWVEDLPAVFAGLRRVLKPGGLMLVSTFGMDTLIELRQAFAEVDEAPHVSPFTAIGPFGDALIAAGFKDPVLDRDEFHLGQPDMASLMQRLQGLGATNALAARRRSLTGRQRFARAGEVYESMRKPDGQLPVTLEAIYAHAWGPPPGAPIRVGGIDEVQVPASSIRVRKR
ncbi:methyltransferase domain-containing protein [Lysobacter ciconiae]|uniref:Malonyl-[acyl-carrier protein] O-methyltransferase n=1 Tax=Novilysobacter ciconiae TaxID=2781022 RepID=A0A7S6UFQ0_9GAMM|nr:methyltransferase domain-containing protein [Lysobacter ciconiae]QOW19431.1 methyltransferase domain-containing protein [Lysobacter ciconiae]